ncbi:MAG: response regulator transcription factor [Planctomycetes bacterium]|nr:response regulator transcription factor [Planctomycetota bacterium]
MNKTRVLVIEDEKQMFDLMRFMMERAGYTFEYMEPTGPIVQHLLDNDFQVLISDFIMPIKNGLEVIREVRHHSELKSLPILLLTSKELLVNETKEVASLKVDYMRKPFVPQVLSSKLKEMVERSAT